ncbi:MAG UNVERIFIED_CONTAM: hypothetical protein LVR18_24515 [Planctomycetaceae bacterium]
MLQQQAADGNLFGRAEPFAQMYCHAIATYAVAEAYAMLRPTPPQSLMTADASRPKAAHRRTPPPRTDGRRAIHHRPTGSHQRWLEISTGTGG